MAEYDRTELERLQKEAANRIREMQNYTQQVVTPVDELPPMPSFVRTPYTRSGGGSRNDPPRREPEREPQRSEEHKEEHKEEKSSPFSLLKMFNFKNMDLDADKALILLMIYLLASDEGDELLLLALLYLLI